MFLALRRLARSGAATIRMSSALISVRLRPAGPLMRHVEHDAGHGRAQRIEDRSRRLRRRNHRRGRASPAPPAGSDDRCISTAGGRRRRCRCGRARTPRRRCLAAGPGCSRDPAVPNGRSRSVTTESSARSRAIAQAILCATVEAPTPPLAPTTAMTRPTGLASGAENSPQIARTTSSVPTGAIR